MNASKRPGGNYFEDFSVGQAITHATPRTVTLGDVALYNALYGARFAVQSSDEFAKSIGYARAPLDDLLVFHIVFGKSVPDISLNAVANLGYADCRFLLPVYPGDTLTARSEVIGLKENSNGKTGVVYVRTTGRNQRDQTVLDFARWVMVKKRDPAAQTGAPVVPELPDHVPPAQLAAALSSDLDLSRYDHVLAGSEKNWGDFEAGEKIDHLDGVTIEEAEHQMATRLYQNTAKVHFDQFAAKDSRFGRRLIYGGVVISMARALSFSGLENAFRIAAINGGRHVAPLFAGDTVYAWSDVLAKAELPGRSDLGALRLRLTATKDRPCHDFPLKNADGKDAEGVILDLDHWVLMPR